MNNVRSIPAQNDPLQKIKKHVRDNQDLYLAVGVGVVSGYLLSKGLRKAPKIDKAAIVTEWMVEMVNDGYNVYALTNEQKALWESCWAYAQRGAKEFGVSLPEAVASLTQVQFKAAEEGFATLRRAI